MKYILFVLVALMTGADGPEQEVNRMQGKWRLVKEHSHGRDNVGLEREWLFEGDQLTVTDRIRGRGTIAFDKTTTPNRYQMTNKAFPEIRVQGLFRNEGDRFITYGLIPPLNDYPLEFSMKPDRKHMLEIWKRIGQPNLNDVDGEWELTEMVVGDRHLNFSEHRMRVANGEWFRDVLQRSHYSIKLDPTTKLKHLDRTRIDKNSRLFEQQSFDVYALDKDRLTVWSGYVPEGSKAEVRRESVSTASESENYFQVFERVRTF